MKTASLVRLCVICFALAISSSAQERPSDVTAVEGESWLSHLHRPLQETSMGNTGRLGPGPEALGDPELLPVDLRTISAASDHVSLQPADLYRINCRACHGEAGLGAPPEINSVINPVRSTSVRLVMERMKNVGMDMSPAEAGKLARQSKDALLKRIHSGGDNMPAFAQLNDVEVGALLTYLNQLSGVTQSTPPMLVKEQGLRVGELIVRSTCHICHSADGDNPNPSEMLEGAIPPLSALTSRVSHAGFIRKVTHGAPVKMGPIPSVYRGRMPVFYYLTPQEVEYVYQYLSETSLQSAHQQLAAATVPPSTDSSPTVPFTAMSIGGEQRSESLAGPLSAVGILAFMLFAAGVWFTIRELRSLSLAKERSSEHLRPVRVEIVRNEELESAS
jgi:mono/diheme cytochrome c family protein